MPVTTWEPGATVTLYRVPWDTNYHDVVQFDTMADRLNYFSTLESLSIGVHSSVYCYPGEPITIDVPYTSAFQYNYAVVSNPVRETDPVTPPINYYYFITGCTQDAPQPTTLTLQPDVWQQYLFDVEMGTGYYTQGHLPMVNTPCLATDNVPATLNRYFSVPEGLDNGPEFQDFFVETYSLQTDLSGVKKADYLAIVSTADLTADPGSIDNPTLKSAVGGFYNGIFSGSAVYLIDLDTSASSVSQILHEMSLYSWVTQCIVSITSVPRALVQSDDIGVAGHLFGASANPQLMTFHAASDGIFDLGTTGASIKTGVILNQGWDGLTDYKDLRKLWAYPYTVVELSNGQNSVFLKPQLLPANDTPVKIMACAVAPYLEAAAIPWGYGSNNPGTFTVSMVQTDGTATTTSSATVPFGDLLDTAVWFDQFPQWSILNNSAIVYMASTAHTRQYQYDTASYNQEMSTLNQARSFSNQVGYPFSPSDQAYAAQAANTLRDLGTGAISSGAEAIAGWGRDMGWGWTQQGTNAAMGLALGGIVSQVPYIGDVWRGLNTGLNDYNFETAKISGDYAQAIKAIESGVADAQLKPPSSVGNVGGQGMRYANGLTYTLFVKYKRINPAYVAKLGDYFKRWGYTVNRYIDIPNDLRICSPCSYWRFAEVYLECARADETDKDRIRAILQQGTTVWAEPCQIGKAKPTDVQPIQSKIQTYYT